MRMTDQRVAYGQALVEAGAHNPCVVVLDADLSKSTQSCQFQQAYPDRFFEMSIAEANMTSFAAGLALTGKIPFTNSFAVFAAGRAYDQIRQSISIAALNVKIVGSAAGLSDYGDGATHQSIDDIAIMRAIPNMTVLVPADGQQVKAMVAWMVEHDGPVYLRLSRNELPEITGENPDPVQPTVLRPGNDVSLLACGTLVYKALEAADHLQREGISARVINVPCLKPFPEEQIRQLVQGTRGIATCEEHSVIGGLSQSVSWALRGNGQKMEAVAVNDTFGQSAFTYDELLQYYHLTVDDMLEKVRSVCN